MNAQWVIAQRNCQNCWWKSLTFNFHPVNVNGSRKKKSLSTIMDHDYDQVKVEMSYKHIEQTIMSGRKKISNK